MTFADIAKDIAEIFPSSEIYSSAGNAPLNSIRLGYSSKYARDNYLFTIPGHTSSLQEKPADGSSLLCLRSYISKGLYSACNLILAESEAQLTAIFNHIQDLISADGNLDSFLKYILASNLTMDELVCHISGFLGNPLLIADLNHRIISMSDDIIDDSAWKRFKALGYVPYNPDVAKEFESFIAGVRRGITVGVYSGKHKENYVMHAALMSGANIIGHVSVYSFKREFQRQDETVLKALAGLIANKVIQIFTVRPEIRQAGEYFIFDLVRGNLKDEGEIVERLKYLKWSLDGDIYLLIVRWNEPPGSMDALDASADLFCQLLGNAGGALVDNDLVILLSREAGSELSQNDLKPFSDSLQDQNAQAIISARLQSVTRVHYEFIKTKTVFDINRKIGRRERLQRTDMGSLELMFHTVSQKYDLVELCHPLILKLMKYDRDNNTKLTHCLEAYICSGRNFSRAAEKLYTHRNTVIYRIGKIGELLGYDFQREETVMHFELSFCLLNYIACIEGKQRIGEFKI